jgi:BirA family transcriptional regulator, biotin operon repressor / biotin---[acetyl-CoA-carboxylase] ligase
MTSEAATPGPDAAALAAALGGRLGEIRVVDECSSTNAELVAWAIRSGARAGVLATRYQSAGRGRLGRTWVSPPGGGIACSVLVSGITPSTVSWLPALAGLAVRDLVTAAGVAAGRIALKWPNDVLVDGRKVAGVLAERLDDGRVVIGFGVNVTLTQEQLPTPEATSLVLCGASTLDQTPLLAAGLQGFADRVTRVASSRGIAMLAREYGSACATLGQRVRVERTGAPAIVGTALGVAADAALVVRPDDGAPEVSVAAGDVVHLRDQRPNLRR